MNPNCIIIDNRDNVAVAVEDIKKGALILLPDESSIPACSDIPAGHKIALRDMKAGEDIIKYGEPIGRLNAAVSRGDWVHIHNIFSPEDDQRENIHGIQKG